MLASCVVSAAIGLALAMVVLLLLGHRVRHRSWTSSLLAVGALTCASLSIQEELTGEVPPPWLALSSALLLGGLLARALRDWNPVGHLTFTALLLLAGSFQAFTGMALLDEGIGLAGRVLGAVLFPLQLLALLLLVAHTFEILDVLCRGRWNRRARARRVPGYAPRVSIHVPIHCEPPELVIETLNALSRLDYDDFEVLVIDNNTADESLWRPVERRCAALGPRFRFFHLDPWPGFKSGALNFALTETDPEAEIVGIVDADYHVERDWLADLVGHFEDERVAFVQTPQDYRDVESRGLYGRALALSYLYFFRVSMPSRNERNAIIFAGTMGLLRRRALVDVGGWDEWCITEDAEVSLRLLDAGHSSVFVERAYGHGIMPLDYAGLKKQRFRWAFGGMQLLRMHARLLFLPWTRGRLTAAQRAAYVSGGLQWFNDPLTFAFTAVLLVAAGVFLTQARAADGPLAAPVLLAPGLLLVFSLLRFLWALRITARTTWLRATQGLVILLGLTWVVTLACARGLLSKGGVFLRTPKQGDEPRLRDALGVVRWELFFACLSFSPALLLARRLDAADALSGRGLLVVLLAWQAAVYLSAVVSVLWNHREGRTRPGSARVPVAPRRVLGSSRRVALWAFLASVAVGLAARARSAAPPVGGAGDAGRDVARGAAGSSLGSTPEGTE